MNCPFCNSANIARKDGKLFCEDCGFEVDALIAPVSPGDSAALPAGLVKCPICSHPVSTQAASCPACGEPLQPPRKAAADFERSMRLVIRKWILWAIVICIITRIIYYVFIGPAIDSYMDSR